MSYILTIDFFYQRHWALTHNRSLASLSSVQLVQEEHSLAQFEPVAMASHYFVCDFRRSNTPRPRAEATAWQLQKNDAEWPDFSKGVVVVIWGGLVFAVRGWWWWWW